MIPEALIEADNIFARLIDIPRKDDSRGSLSFIEGENHIPFKFERVFYLYDIKKGESRGNHSHKVCHQFIIALNGSFTVILDNGINKVSVKLSCNNSGLYIPPGIWAIETEFQSGSVCLVIASHKYDEDDYIRNYNDFLVHRGLTNDSCFS